MNVPLNHPMPLLDLDVLRTFVAIAETGSFTLAANAVFRTPSAVSMQIKKLEEVLGVSVFSRDARSVSLTKDGEMLMGLARRMLALNREAVSRFIVPDIAGVVRLGSPDDYGERVLPQVLKRFAQTHPAIAVDVTIDQSVNLRRRLAEGIEDFPGQPLLLHPPFAAAVVDGAVAGEVVLHAEEQRQQVVPAPAGVALGGPAVVVAGLAAHVDHAVDRRAAAEHAAAGVLDGAAVEAGNGLGV